MLTVLFATRNRAALLAKVLEAFCLLEEPSSGWRLVVVDNGSCDETAHVLESFVGRLPLYPLFEPEGGKNDALNAGLRLAEGDLTVLTDDDVFPNRDWLLEMKRAADDHPECSIFGGKIVPRWEVPPPPWIQWTDLGPAFSITPVSLTEGQASPYLIFGPNMAIRTRIFRCGTRFDPSIGPRGPSYPMGSETELVVRLAELGNKAWHVRGAIVEHFVRKEQLRRTWVLQRAVRYGRGQYRLGRVSNPAKSKYWFGIPRHLYRDIPKQAATVVVAWALSRPDTLFRARWRFNLLRGAAIEAMILSREQRILRQTTC